VRGEPQYVARAVVDPGEDLNVDAARELRVREVGLPAFVGEFGFETPIRRFGSLLWCGDDQAGVHQDPMDRCGTSANAVVAFEMPGDRVRTRVESLREQSSPQLADQGDNRLVSRGR
jgi:hypothetical protein